MKGCSEQSTPHSRIYQSKCSQRQRFKSLIQNFHAKLQNFVSLQCKLKSQKNKP